MEIVVVERLLDEPRTYEELEALETGCAGQCFQLYGVRHVHSYFSKDRKRMICVYEAPDAEAVRQANRIAGVPFERVWTADVYPRGKAEPMR